ncbi:hypothetical protein JMN23_21810 [Bacillus sp. RHFB]|nr:hypothetical protein [Bacillus sp. RHFB]
MTQEEFVSALGTVLDKEVPLQKVDGITYGNLLKDAGVPEEQVLLLANVQKGIRDGGLEVESNDFEKILGRPATPLNEALSQIVTQISLN